jgi:3'-phosphoadenosine 5'-phosphosulfate sulfotransferase
MSKLIHLPAKKTYNTNVETVDIHILFNMNDKSVDNIKELNNVLEYCEDYDIYFQININKFYKTWNKLKNYIDDTKSNVVFLFCQYNRSHLLFLAPEQNQRHIICFTEKIQTMTNINKPFLVKNQGAGGLKTN